MSAASLLQAVAEVATLAAARALAHFPGGRGGATRAAGLGVETKADGSPVTVADREAERAVRDWVERRFPTDGVLGEEAGVTRPDARRRWIVDPIDGTKSFVRGVPLWGTLVAVAEGDWAPGAAAPEVIAGAACFAAAGETVVAARGEGCWWNGARCAVSGEDELARATALITSERFRGGAEEKRAGWARLSSAVAVTRTWGDAYGYLLVATGRAEVMVDPVLSDWDAAAVMVIVEEAGGVFTDWSGARTPWNGSAMATNAALARAARECLK